MKLLLRSILLLALAYALAACDSGRKSPPKVPVIAINAAPSYADLTFLRVEQIAGTLGYRQGQAFSFDADTYRIHIDTSTPDGTSRTRLLEITQTMTPEHEYTFLLREIGGVLDAQVLEDPIATDTSVRVMHAASTLGTVDAYIAPAGADLTIATPLLTDLAFGDITGLLPFAGGSYVLTLTEPGNPANVLLTTPEFSLSGATSVEFAIVDGANVGVDPYSVMVATDVGVANFADPTVDAAVRIINTVSDRNPIDLPIDEQTPALFADVPFGTVSDYLPVPAGQHTFTANAAGAPNAAIIDSHTLTLTAGRRYTILVGGDVGAADAFTSVDDLRPVPDRARVHFFNGSAPFTAVDFFLVPAGTDFADATGTLVLPDSAVENHPFPAGDYDIMLRQNGSTTILAGPIPVTLAAGGVYGIAAVDSAAGGSLDVVLFDDFN